MFILLGQIVLIFSYFLLHVAQNFRAERHLKSSGPIYSFSHEKAMGLAQGHTLLSPL
jgi:hypothetical protein